MVDLGRNSMSVMFDEFFTLAHNELDAVSNEYRNNLLRVAVSGQNSNPIKSTFPHVNQNIDS
jgi:hypothetical protein